MGALLGSGTPALADSTASDGTHGEEATPQVVPPGTPGLTPAPLPAVPGARPGEE